MKRSSADHAYPAHSAIAIAEQAFVVGDQDGTGSIGQGGELPTIWIRNLGESLRVDS